MRGLAKCFAVATALVVCGFGCGDELVGQPPPSEPAAIVQTAGGGQLSSAGHKATVRIGAPQPMGQAASSTSKVRLGPGPHL